MAVTELIKKTYGPLAEKNPTRKGKVMKNRQKRRMVLAFSGVLTLSGSVGWAADGIISKVSDPSGSFCHLRFPAIREESLLWDRPVLKDPSEGDIVDFYGPCDYDPLGKAEIQRQRADIQRERNRRDGDQ